MADSFNIGAILDALTSNTEQRVAGVQATERQQVYDTDQLQSLMTSNIEAARGVIAQKTTLAESKAGLEFANADLQQRAQAIVGLNPEDLNNDFIKSVADYDASEEKRKIAQSRQSELASVGLLDNPVVWLFNQLELPSVERQVASATTESAAAAKDIQTRTAMLNQHRNSVVANTADTAAQYNLKLAQVSAQEAFVKLREEETRNLSAISSRRMNEASLRDKVFNLKDDQINKVLSIDELVQRRADRALQYDSVAEQRRAKLEEKNAEQAAVDQANANLRDYANITGQPPMTVEMLKLMPKERAAKYWNVATTGSLGANLGDVYVTLAGDDEALANIATNNPLLAQTIKNVSQSLENVATTVEKTVGPDGKKPTKKDAFVQALTVVQDEWEKSTSSRGFSKPLNSVHWDKQYNPYRADHNLIATLFDSGRLPALEGKKFLSDNIVRKTAETLRLAKGDPQVSMTGEDETSLLKVIGEKVARREIQPKVAAQQIVEYYSAAAQIQRDQTQYGIFKLPAQNSYIVGIEAQGMFGRPITADLMNKGSVEKMLLEMATTNTQRLMEDQTTKLRMQLGGAGTDTNAAAGRALITGPVFDYLRGYKKEDAQ